MRLDALSSVLLFNLIRKIEMKLYGSKEIKSHANTDEVRAHLTGRHDVRAVQTSYSSGNNAISERTEYEMSERYP